MCFRCTQRSNHFVECIIIAAAAAIAAAVAAAATATAPAIVMDLLRCYRFDFCLTAELSCTLYGMASSERDKNETKAQCKFSFRRSPNEICINSVRDTLMYNYYVFIVMGSHYLHAHIYTECVWCDALPLYSWQNIRSTQCSVLLIEKLQKRSSSF